MKTAVLLLGHGSRAAGANAAMERVAGEIRRRTSYVVAMGFMEWNSPTIDEGLAECVRQGAERVLVLPYFLHLGQHVRCDLPRRVAAGQACHPHVQVTLGPSIGYHPALVDILLERVAEAASAGEGETGRHGDGETGRHGDAAPGPARLNPEPRTPNPRPSTGYPALPAGMAIEGRSFEIIESEVGEHGFSPGEFAVVRRVIHATADFEFAHSLVFHPEAVAAGMAAIRAGLPIVTDVEMVRTGVLRRCSDPFGIAVHCFIADPEVCECAAAEGSTRAVQAMRRAAHEGELGILSVGNAPTALLEAIRLVCAGEMHVRLIVGTPVGFISAAESKEALLGLETPYIAARGRKGGSPVAAAAVNALLHLAREVQ